MSEILILFPEIFLGLAACSALILGLFFRSINVFILMALVGAGYLLYYQVPNEAVFGFDNLFKSNSLIKLLKLIILCVAALFILIYRGQKFTQNSRLKLYEFQVLLLLSVTGMMLTLSSNNFLSLYISIELQSLCLYVLSAFERENSKSSEAGLKYFILGSFASGLLLFGISLIYGFTGNLDFTNLSLLLSSNQSSDIAIGVVIGVVMLLIGLFFKVSAAPFHMWTPDVYQGSPTIVTCFFAAVTKIAAVGILLRLSVEVFFPWKMDLEPILIIITCASLLVGAIGALKQDNLKRLLAYSSIGHVGYMLLAISTFMLDTSVISYLIIYASMTLGTFAMIMSINNEGKEIVVLQDLSGLAKTNPFSAAALAVFMLSLAGIPPFAGFFAKFYIFQTAINAKLYIPVLISIVAAVIAAYYYLKIIKIMYLDEAKGKFGVEMNLINKVVITLLVLFNLGYVMFRS